MKLRLRSSETKETLRIEVPDPCSLQLLKQILSQKLSSSSISAPPDSIHLSLNRKDEIQSSSPDDETLHALGIASGDLIFFTVGSNGVSSETLVPKYNSRPSISISNSEPSISNETAISVNPNLQSQEPSLMEWQNQRTSLNLEVEPTDQPGSSNLNSPNDESLDDTEIDVADDESLLEGVGKSFSAPGFLRKVFTEELDGTNAAGRNHKLLVIAVHAVLLESGFVGFDMNLKTEINKFPYQADWPSSLSLFYTLPGVIGHVLPSSECYNGVVTLKFQSVGTFLNVYGFLSAGSTIHSVRLKEDELVSFLNVAWANCGLIDEIASKDGISWTTPAREVFNFWRMVKDKLALPLLIDLCERAGLELPPCFMRLPIDLKLKILESLHGVDIAKVSCVSSELRYLSSNDDLWKQKYVEQFGDAGKSDGRGNWKEKFVRYYESAKRRKTASRFYKALHPRRRIIDPVPCFPPHWPRIIGGDYDMGPQISPFGQVRIRNPRYPSRSHIPICNLGGHGDRNVV